MVGFCKAQRPVFLYPRSSTRRSRCFFFCNPPAGHHRPPPSLVDALHLHCIPHRARGWGVPASSGSAHIRFARVTSSSHISLHATSLASPFLPTVSTRAYHPSYTPFDPSIRCTSVPSAIVGMHAASISSVIARRHIP